MLIEMVARPIERSTRKNKKNRSTDDLLGTTSTFLNGDEARLP